MPTERHAGVEINRVGRFISVQHGSFLFETRKHAQTNGKPIQKIKRKIKHNYMEGKFSYEKII